MKAIIRLSLLGILIVLALGSCALTWSRQVPSASGRPVTIPADVTGYGLIFLQARVNNSAPLWFALDCGASFPFVIDIKRARALGLKLQDNLALQGGAGPGAYEVAMTKGVSVDLGGLKFTDQTAAVIALGSLEAIAGRALDGLVGRPLFNQYVVEIDYSGQRINLYEPRSFTYTGTGERIPLMMQGDYFFVPAKIEMPGSPQFEGQFLVDTGGGLVTAILNAPLARSRNLPSPSQKTILDRSLSGLGGEIRLRVSRATSVALGNLLIPAPVIYVSQDRAGALATADFDGVIGGEILRRFKVIFDYPRRRLILEPNASYAEPVEYDMSGIRLRAGGSEFRTFTVFQVIEGSPAAEAGLREGDVITDVDGIPASRFSLDEIYRMFKQQGHEYRLKLTRGRGTFSVTIKMRRLV